MSKSIITPIKIGAGAGRFVVRWPVGGEVVHGSMDYVGSVILWVRHQTDASLLHKAFLLKGASQPFDSQDEVVSVIQFEVEQMAEPSAILTPGQPEAPPETIARQVLIFVIDAGVTNEETTNEAIG